MTALDSLHDRIIQVEWFKNCGEPYSSVISMEVVSVRTWKQALTRSGSIAMSNAWMEGSALLTREVGLNHRLEYRKWNDHVAVAHETLGAEVFPKVDAIIEAIPAIAEVENGPEFLKDHMRWDLVGVYMEHVYAHLVPPRFYALLFEVYAAGHFPCGWDEVWPNGKLWVY